MSNGLQVVPSALLVANMGADGRVSCRASQVLAFAERNVLTLGVLVALGETEINDVDVVFSALITSNQKVIRLDITMNDPLFVHFLNSVDHLNRDMQHSFEVEFSAALLEEIL